ncbi:siderophore ABC transporter substrate-binding protein [Corynebacterium sp. 335C]
MAACSDSSASGDAHTKGTDTAAAEGGEGAGTITVEDNFGEQTVPSPAERVVITDNRSFETLAEWGVEPVAAPMKLVPDAITFKNQDQILDMGNHREPDFEKVVEAQPDLIVNGQRFAKQRDKLIEAAPEAAIVDFTPRDDKPFDEELIRQTENLGKIFGKEEEAQKLVDDFKASIERAKKAYDGQTTMGLITSGGEINYSAPGAGRSVGPVFDILGLEPSLKVDGTSDHQGDDISVEAIAESNPQLILVMDRDAGVKSNDEGSAPAADLIADSAALQNVDAVKNGNIVYFPKDTYTNESIQTYTEFFNTLADQLEKQK